MKNRQLILGLLICLIGVSVVFIGTYISMNDKKEDATIKHELAMVLIDENGNETDTETFPSTTEYYLDFSKSFCENGSQLSWDKANNKAEVIANKADKCNLYFRKNTQYSLKSAVLATNAVNKETVDFSVDVAEGEASLNRAIDDNGYSYYFRGDVENNYVEFGTYAKEQVIGYRSASSTLFYNFYDTLEACNSATTSNKNCTYAYEAGDPMYWRIVRINGDGSIRLIYSGPELVENGTNHQASIGTIVYNSIGGSEQYTGYTYEGNDGTQMDSTAKIETDKWYTTHLKNNYEKHIADSIFCNDRTDGTTYKAPYDRVTNYNPALKCPSDGDKFTVNSNNGNGYLTHPIGMISVDEAMMNGSSGSKALSFLYSGERYWSMSTGRSTGYVYAILDNVTSVFGPIGVTIGTVNVRPVINIKADTMFTGLGTIDSPYKLVETATE